MNSMKFLYLFLILGAGSFQLQAAEDFFKSPQGVRVGIKECPQKNCQALKWASKENIKITQKAKFPRGKNSKSTRGAKQSYASMNPLVILCDNLNSTYDSSGKHGVCRFEDGSVAVASDFFKLVKKNK